MLVVGEIYRAGHRQGGNVSSDSTQGRLYGEGRVGMSSRRLWSEESLTLLTMGENEGREIATNGCEEKRREWAGWWRMLQHKPRKSNWGINEESLSPKAAIQHKTFVNRPQYSLSVHYFNFLKSFSFWFDLFSPPPKKKKTIFQKFFHHYYHHYFTVKCLFFGSGLVLVCISIWHDSKSFFILCLMLNWPEF